MPDTDQPDNSSKPSFWVTLPGVLTGVAGVVGAIAALVVSLKEANVIGQPSTPAPPTVEATSMPSGNEAAKSSPPASANPTTNTSTTNTATTPATNTVATGASSNAAKPFESDTEFQEDLAEYLKAPNYKAFFVSLDDQGDWEYDWSTGRANQSDADAAATAGCQESVQAAQMQATCKAYARGNSIVW